MRVTEMMFVRSRTPKSKIRVRFGKRFMEDTREKDKEGEIDTSRIVSSPRQRSTQKMAGMMVGSGEGGGTRWGSKVSSLT